MDVEKSTMFQMIGVIHALTDLFYNDPSKMQKLINDTGTDCPRKPEHGDKIIVFNIPNADDDEKNQYTLCASCFLRVCEVAYQNKHKATFWTKSTLQRWLPRREIMEVIQYITDNLDVNMQHVHKKYEEMETWSFDQVNHETYGMLDHLCQKSQKGPLNPNEVFARTLLQIVMVRINITKPI